MENFFNFIYSGVFVCRHFHSFTFLTNWHSTCTDFKNWGELLLVKNTWIINLHLLHKCTYSINGFYFDKHFLLKMIYISFNNIHILLLHHRNQSYFFNHSWQHVFERANYHKLTYVVSINLSVYCLCRRQITKRSLSSSAFMHIWNTATWQNLKAFGQCNVCIYRCWNYMLNNYMSSLVKIWI